MGQNDNTLTATVHQAARALTPDDKKLQHSYNVCLKMCLGEGHRR